MAPGLPYAIAAQIAHPGRQCIAFVGDGGFAMLMAEFLTAAGYGLPIKVIISNNAAFGQIFWEQMALGLPEHGVRWEKEANFAPWAEACGGLGIRVAKPAEVGPAIAAALAHPGPASSTWSSIPTNRRCRPRSPMSRPRASPRLSARAGGARVDRVHHRQRQDQSAQALRPRRTPRQRRRHEHR